MNGHVSMPGNSACDIVPAVFEKMIALLCCGL